MNISPLNNYSNRNVSKSQNFQGLWGKPSMSTDFDNGLGCKKVEITNYYYPFRNESADAVRAKVNGVVSARIDRASSPTQFITEECKLCAPLPFTEADYKKYKKVNSRAGLTEQVRNIHEHVKDKFQDGDKGPSKTEAVNDVVSKMLNYQV